VESVEVYKFIGPSDSLMKLDLVDLKYVPKTP